MIISISHSPCICPPTFPQSTSFYFMSFYFLNNFVCVCVHMPQYVFACVFWELNFGSSLSRKWFDLVSHTTTQRTYLIFKVTHTIRDGNPFFCILYAQTIPVRQNCVIPLFSSSPNPRVNPTCPNFTRVTGPCDNIRCFQFHS